MRNPCKKDCPGRSPTCHAECGAYLDFYAWCKETREQERKQSVTMDYIAKEVRKGKSKSLAWKGKA